MMVIVSKVPASEISFLSIHVAKSKGSKRFFRVAYSDPHLCDEIPWKFLYLVVDDKPTHKNP